MLIEDDKLVAYKCGGRAAHEYAKSIGKTDLKDFTGEEWIYFCECMCKNFLSKKIEIDRYNVLTEGND